MTSIVILLMLASTGVLAAVEAVIVTIGSIQTVLGVVEAVLVPSSSSPHVTGDLEAGVSAGLVMALLTSGLSGLAPLPLTVPVTMMTVMPMFVSASSTLTLLHLVISAWHL